MYHTQEKRTRRISNPLLCEKDNAWLGIGYYFWQNNIDAIHWGKNSKRRTGFFEIYSADINCDDVLDTVFNEKHYNFWIAQIEKAATNFVKRTGIKPTVKEINRYFAEKAKWDDVVTGIMFHDLPFVEDLLVKNMNYRKRIQLVAFTLNIVRNFSFHSEFSCY